MVPDVFVFVPSYNHSAFVSECLNSIINQTRTPKKLLVIDDGSKDDSPKVIEKALKDAPFECELIVRENRGLCRTLNEAFERSSGEYFAYLGSDDYWLPGFIEARTELLAGRKDAVLGYGHAHLIDEDGSIFDTTEAYSDGWANYPDGDARPMLIEGGAPISSTVFYRRSALEEVEWNEDARLEDYEMYLKLMDKGEFAFDPRTLSAWRQHRSNTSGNRFLMLDEVLAAQERNFDRLRITREELLSMRVRTKFRHARIELQHGEKLEALRLAGTSWSGAKSIRQLAVFLLRMLLPTFVVKFRRSLRRGG